MANKILIDAAHSEETRVVAIRGRKIEEFDYETTTRQAIRGNIYLAKVTRVEPSLQAAFVDFGGNRHGFLAFSEIHPDYYQIPVADRKALIEQAKMEALAAKEAAEAAKEAHERNTLQSSEFGEKEELIKTGKTDKDSSETDNSTNSDHAEETQKSVAKDPITSKAIEDKIATDTEEEFKQKVEYEDLTTEIGGVSEEIELPEFSADITDDNYNDDVESVGADLDIEEEILAPKIELRKYKIQEVIKPRQIILVQVAKEERGNKGAALTTYISLAGRYCVLMPNTNRGGGISRKITDIEDRKRLKEIAEEIEIPEGMGLIVRTAGAERNKTEINRDFDYLLRLWENIRDLTLQSSAPCLVYEEGNLIKRSIRDLYTDDIDQIIVSGEQGYKEAKTFMKMLLPSHAKNVKSYRENKPIFTRYHAESQLAELFNTNVTLESGGYLVINQTEALVSIDINSGKSTKEHSIEDTALSTNLEAAEEITRQLRLRDLAGLVVIDFIDMSDRRNNRAVENKLKESLKRDRARIQVGRISHFGLLEMSRQRMRSSVAEVSTQQCPKCEGRGFVRSVESASIHVLRGVEDSLPRNKGKAINVNTSIDAALYILNYKRDHLARLEENYNVSIAIVSNPNMPGAEFSISKRTNEYNNLNRNKQAVRIDTASPETDENNNQGSKKIRGRRNKNSRLQKNDTDNKEQENKETKENDTIIQDNDNIAPPSSSDNETLETDTQKPKRKRRPYNRRRSRNEIKAEADEEKNNTNNKDKENNELNNKEKLPAPIKDSKKEDATPNSDDVKIGKEAKSSTSKQNKKRGIGIFTGLKPGGEKEETNKNNKETQPSTNETVDKNENVITESTAKPRLGWWRRKNA